MAAWHAWMHEHWAAGPPLKLALDGRALSMYQAVKSAIADFMAETKMPVVYKSKLMFWHSDILRDCHKVFRATQFLQSMSKAHSARCSGSPCHWTSSRARFANGFAR